VGVLVGVFLVATTLAGYLVFATVRDLVAGWNITAFDPTPVSVAGKGLAATPSGNTNPVGSLIPQKWGGVERVTVLLMGIDRRQGENEKGYLTDSMILVTVDPVAQTGGMLSIPRDLWVEIPGYEVNTINTANRTGDYYDYPGGGPALAVKTVEHNLGVTVDYYVRLDFTAFETVIDKLGGIDVYNETEINDPFYPDGSYGYEPFYLPAGQQHLNGRDALRYARTRHDSSDIARAQRQQQVVLAIREKVLAPGTLARLITEAPQLYQTLNQSVWTNMSLNQIIGLALLAQDIPREDIRSAVIDYQYVLDYTTPEGRQVLVPLRDKIRELRDSMFATSAAIAPPTDDELKALMATEGARIEVLNGAGVEGLARATSEWLTEQGVNVVNFDTADRTDYPNSVIVTFTDKPYTARWLAKTFNVSGVVSGSDPSGTADIRVILGQDWRVPTTP